MSIFYNEIGSALPQNAALQHSEACKLALRDLLQLVERACSALNDYIADLIGLSRCLDRCISSRDYCIGLIVDVLLQLVSECDSDISIHFGDLFRDEAKRVLIKKIEKDSLDSLVLLDP